MTKGHETFSEKTLTEAARVKNIVRKKKAIITGLVCVLQKQALTKH